jgi:hypothetical protein
MNLHYVQNICLKCGCDLVVCIATRYRFEGTGFKPTWMWDFPCPSRLAPESTSFQCNGYGFFFPGGKGAEARRPRIPSSRKNRPIGYIYSLSVPSHGRGRSLPLTLYLQKKTSLFITILGILFRITRYAIAVLDEYYMHCFTLSSVSSP